MSILLSLDKAAEALGGISIWTLRAHVKCGNVRVTHIGRRVFLDEQEMTRIVRDGLPSLGVNAGQASPEHTEGVDHNLVKASAT